MKSIFRLEFRHSNLRFAVVPLAVLGVIAALNEVYPLIATWENTAVALMSASAFLGPFWAGMGAWEGLRAYRRRLHIGDRAAARSLLQIRLPQYLATSAWMLVTTALVYVTVIARAALIGLYDAPSAPALALPAITNLFSLSLGYAIAQVVIRWWAIAVSVTAVTGLYSMTMMPIKPYWIQAISPYQDVFQLEGFDLSGLFIIARIGFTLGLAGAFLTLALIMMHTRLSTLAIATAVSTLLVGSASSVAISQQGMAVGQAQAATLMTVASSDPDLTLRIQPDYTPVAPRLLAGWGRVASLFEKSDLRFTELTQDLEAIYGAKLAERPYRLDLNPGSDEILEASIDSMLHDIQACNVDALDVNPTGWIEGHFALQIWLRGVFPKMGMYIPEDDETFDAVDRLNALSLPEAQEWVAEHTENIRNCHWERSDFL